MSHRVLAIAINTFREAMRARLLYVLIFGALATVGSGAVFSHLALGDPARITKDVGLATIDFLGVVIIVFLGATILYKEVEKRTIVLLLSKPIHRAEFLVGKFLALTMTVGVAVLVVTVCVEIALYAQTGAMDGAVLWAAGMGLLMLVTMNAVALLYSCVAGPMVAAFLTLATFVAGRLAGDLADFATAYAPALLPVFYLLPNLASMDIRPQVVHGFPLELQHLSLAVLHGLTYTGAALVLAILSFRTREFR